MTHGLLKFPIDSEESASFEKLDNLLPQQTYESLVRLIEDSLNKLDKKTTSQAHIALIIQYWSMVNEEQVKHLYWSIWGFISKIIQKLLQEIR